MNVGKELEPCLKGPLPLDDIAALYSSVQVVLATTGEAFSATMAREMS